MSKTGLALLVVFNFVVIGCENKEIIMDNGLIIEDIIIGVGTTAEKYSIATVHYTGKLQDGTVFDSSQKIGREPLRFTLGVGQVIDGWDQGVIGMKVGGQRKLKIPPELGLWFSGFGRDSALFYAHF
jgi:FKBP-type peptidyl-prolyl cis-trans isomerase